MAVHHKKMSQSNQYSSMGDSWQGGVKIESAKAAATQIINLIQRESEIGDVAHQVGLAVFSTDAALSLPLTTDYEGARNAIAAMGPEDWTNIGAGLTVANDELTNAPPGAKRIVILLSDGQTNKGLSRDEILSGPVRESSTLMPSSPSAKRSKLSLPLNPPENRPPITVAW